MERNITELVLIIDRSGSMCGLESDTIGGINAVLRSHRKESGECMVSTVLFDDTTKVLHDRVPIAEVADLTERDYRTRGCTALLDAVGGSIKHIERVQRYMPPEYRASHVIFVITTDGMENASRRWTYENLKKLLGRKQEEENWEFLFLGANIDAAAEAGRIGIPRDRAETYVADEEGTEAMYDAVACASVAMRDAPAGARIGGDWRDPIARDRKRRK